MLSNIFCMDSSSRLHNSIEFLHFFLILSRLTITELGSEFSSVVKDCKRKSLKSSNIQVKLCRKIINTSVFIN